MTVETEVATLTTAVDNLTTAVNVSKSTLDASVADALGHSGTASTHKTGAETAKSGAESARDQAYTYSQSAASAVAYQDLTAIAESKSDTAVDVFVYDTSKDSDGGAWRKRTQHTSWYNETLNTSTRGSRKEFPAVAVIVAESNQVTIYDGDDPSMPMWMVFNGSGTAWLGGGSKAITTLNGQLAVAGNIANGRLQIISFIKDNVLDYATTSTGAIRGGLLPVSGRNSETPYGQTLDSTVGIVERNVNDVAMTVLPNAPIDPATGLPIPTIAVATDGGVSVIKDDGSVVDIVHSNYGVIDTVFFTPEGGIGYTTDSNNNARWLHVDHTIPTTDVAKGVGYVGTSSDEMYHSVDGSAYSGEKMKVNRENFQAGMVISGSTLMSGTSNGMILLDRNIQTPQAGMVCEVTSDFNTGWMIGGADYNSAGSYVKGTVLAALSDTDDTDVTGSELVTNGTFDSDTSGWTSWDNLTRPSSASQASGKGVLDASGGTCDARQEIAVVAGKTYVVSATMLNNSGASGRLYISDGANYNYAFGSFLATGTETTQTITVTPTQTTLRLYAYNNGTGIAYFDNISVRLAEPDRSVNNNGLAVHGTITKNPVATGADLVGYSGFSPSNYLQSGENIIDASLPFNFTVWAPTTRLAFGYVNAAGQVAYDGSPIVAWCSGSSLNVRGKNLTNVTITTTGKLFNFVYNGTNFLIYIDGVLVHSQAAALVNVAGASLLIGKYYYGAVEANISSQSQSLFRISATAPSASQIAKIYEDEKVLFQKNAKATLYGSSDAVTALAHDSDTNLLHVGTSSGRSVFSGLKRVDNTTDAVGSCISASNNLVVED